MSLSRLIILSAFFSFTTASVQHYCSTKAWRFALHLLSLPICQRSLGHCCPEWKPEGLDLSAGPVPVFPVPSYMIFTETRELQHTQTRAMRTALVRMTCARYNKYIFRKEVFQPHLPVRLPCYDLAPITSFALGRSSR